MENLINRTWTSWCRLRSAQSKAVTFTLIDCKSSHREAAICFMDSTAQRLLHVMCTWVNNTVQVNSPGSYHDMPLQMLLHDLFIVSSKRCRVMLVSAVSVKWTLLYLQLWCCCTAFSLFPMLKPAELAWQIAHKEQRVDNLKLGTCCALLLLLMFQHYYIFLWADLVIQLFLLQHFQWSSCCESAILSPILLMLLLMLLLFPFWLCHIFDH